jgi:hypothetical protein
VGDEPYISDVWRDHYESSLHTNEPQWFRNCGAFSTPVRDEPESRSTEPRESYGDSRKDRVEITVEPKNGLPDSRAEPESSEASQRFA